MDGLLTGIDVVVIGAGPAGSATAIWCLLQGLCVAIIESKSFPRHRPGETLHPGAEIIFRQLHVFEEVNQLAKIRHTGYYLASKGEKKFFPYGKDERGDWHGFQTRREDLDTVLLNKARSLGAIILQPLACKEPILKSGRVVGVKTVMGDILSKFVVDCSGSSQWLRKSLRLPLIEASPKLLVRYGYMEKGDSTGIEPVFTMTKKGWFWTALVTDSLQQWTELNIDNEPFYHVASPQGSTRGADVTWRRSAVMCGPGFFLTGDAAIIIDPAASKGVFRALYSGVMASSAIGKIIQDARWEINLLQHYNQSMENWFTHDCNALRKLYNEYGLSF